MRRAAAPVIDLQRRSDLMKAADLLAFRLGDIDKAIDTLMQVRESFGEDPEVLKALDRQLTACARFGELATLLERSASTSAISSSVGRVPRRSRLRRSKSPTMLKSAGEFCPAVYFV